MPGRAASLASFILIAGIRRLLMDHKNAAGSSSGRSGRSGRVPLPPWQDYQSFALVLPLLFAFVLRFTRLAGFISALRVLAVDWGQCGRGRGNCHTLFAVAYSVVKSFL